MRRTDFSFALPGDLIAQAPPTERAAGRLLTLDGAGGALADRQVRDLPDLLRAGDLLVFNNSRVIPARLIGHKPSGGRVEVLVERLLGERRARAFVRASKTPRDGTDIELPGGARAHVIKRVGGLFELEFDTPLLAYLERHGDIPLPPYIQRPTDSDDASRYQTVYAQPPGSAAAPTAGLHFDTALLERLAACGVQTAYVTLHVGAGTFEPVRSDDLSEHRMHSEYAELGAGTCAAIRATREAGGRVIAVGTTTMRTLESAARDGEPAPFAGDTNLFITPGFNFNVVDALLTNFHLPESTLLMLVCAFAGIDHTLAAYRHAVDARYRFFSYGDAMFVLPQRSRQ